MANQVYYVPSQAMGNVNETTHVQPCLVAGANPIVQGQWVELINPDAQPVPSIDGAGVTTGVVYGVALWAGAVGETIPVAIAGYCGLANCTDPGVGTDPLGTPMELNAGVPGEVFASTFSAAFGDGNVAPMSVVAYAAALIPNLAVTGPFIIVGHSS